jgi:FtsH-binding integral membrane protein
MVFLAPISTSIGLTLMTITSITFAPLLGVIMLEMDENDGLRAILLTCFITMAAALVGMYSGIDFSFMRTFLFYSLCALILIGLVRIFVGMSSAMIRVKAIAGAILFTLFLVYDFNRLKNLNDIGANDWSTALHIAISIYLDILNLLLEILAAMGES